MMITIHFKDDAFYHGDTLVGELIDGRFVPNAWLMSLDPDLQRSVDAQVNRIILDQQGVYTEICFMWKEWNTVEGEDKPRLLTPWADPDTYEWPMDWMFKTPAQALAAKHEHAPQEKWVLCKVTTEPVYIVNAEEDQ